MRMQTSNAVVGAVMAAAAPTILLTKGALAASGSQALDVTQLVQVALEVNPQVRAARARWESAEQSIKQAYAPNDPQVSYTNGDSAATALPDRRYQLTSSNCEVIRFVAAALGLSVRACCRRREGTPCESKF